MKSIRKIAEESFNTENWEMSRFKEDIKSQIGDRGDRDTFIDELCEGFERNEVMVLKNEWHRGMGKTWFISHVAKEYGIPIITNTRVEAREIISVMEYAYQKPYEETIGTYEELKNKIDDSKYVLLNEIPIKNKYILDELKERKITPLGFMYDSNSKYEFIK